MRVCVCLFVCLVAIVCVCLFVCLFRGQALLMGICFYSKFIFVMSTGSSV